MQKNVVKVVVVISTEGVERFEVLFLSSNRLRLCCIMSSAFWRNVVLMSRMGDPDVVRGQLTLRSRSASLA